MTSTWAPFLVVGIAVLLYFIGDAERKTLMKKDLNFYLICAMVTAIASILAGLQFDRGWTAYAVWIIAAISTAAIVWRYRSARTDKSSTASNNDRGPL